MHCKFCDVNCSLFDSRLLTIRAVSSLASLNFAGVSGRHCKPVSPQYLTLLCLAALQFLSDIDNVALSLARDGYLSDSLEEVAGDVSLMKLPRNHNDTLQVLDSVFMAIILLAMVIMYVLNVFVF